MPEMPVRVRRSTSGRGVGWWFLSDRPVHDKPAPIAQADKKPDAVKDQFVGKVDDPVNKDKDRKPFDGFKEDKDKRDLVLDGFKDRPFDDRKIDAFDLK